MADETLNTFYTIKPLNSALKFFGLSCIILDGTQLKHSWSLHKTIFYITLFAVANLCGLYIKFYIISGASSSFTFKDVIQLVYLLGYVQYIIDLYFVHKNKSVYLEYIIRFDHIDKILGKNYYSAIKHDVVLIYQILIGTGICCAVFDYVSWFLSYGWILPTIYGMDYIYFGLKVLSIVEIIANVVQLEYRLRVIGDLLEADYNSLPPISKEVKVVVEHEIHQVLEVATLNLNKSDLIQWITRCYLLILDQADYFNAMFGFRILHTSIIFLITMIIILNIIIRLILGSLEVGYEWKYMLIVATFFRIIVGCLVVVWGICRFESCYRQPERILRIIDHTLLNRNICSSTEHALRGLRTLILSRSLSFHAYHFYRLDFPFLVSITSATVTYTIILLQYVQ